MPAFSSFFGVWAQVAPRARPDILHNIISWLIFFGDPVRSIGQYPGAPALEKLIGGMLFWVKVVGLLSLLAWVLSWVTTALKERPGSRVSKFDLVALVALILSPSAVLLGVLESVGQIRHLELVKIPLPTLVAIVCGGVILVWAELALWRTILRKGSRADLVVLFALHAALALGLVIGNRFVLEVSHFEERVTGKPTTLSWQDGLAYGAKLAGTYMGFVVFTRILIQVVFELFAVRARRLFSIAQLSWIESNRRMWAPWVVISMFLVILAFTHWFLNPPRTAEMGRLYVGTLSLLCSLLLTVMVTILAPLSLPHDIQYQTIYTVVSKPVRRIELIWGRMLGFMAIVTVLVVIFYSISLLYLWRTVGGKIDETEKLAVREIQSGRITQAKQLREQAEQLRTRMAARVPVYGSLRFLDSKGEPHAVGIDVGQEQSTRREPRSHIEGATPAAAIWTYGYRIPDPFDLTGRIFLDRPIAVDEFLAEGTIEALQNQAFNLKDQLRMADQAQNDPSLPPARVRELTAAAGRNREELQRITSAYEQRKAEADKLMADADSLPADRSKEADDLRRQAAALHSAPIPIEMTFSIYRTTKGKLGVPVYAELRAKNPYTQAEYSDIFPIHEYYTDKRTIPASVLAGSHGALQIEVHCLTSSQYLGMAQADLYLLARPGNFGVNFLKGLFGVWLQAMVLTAIGVFAGTFLSWPVALLTTISFFVAGQVAFNFLLEFTSSNFVGGGPFESMIRLLSHDNQVSDLDPTAAVVTAKTLDSLVMPIMSRLAYIVPNFGALDVSDTVANGFDVSTVAMVQNFFLALAYALPFSVAGFFILKNREVAA